MVTINLHACEATTQETVGRGSSIDLHVCGASVCVEEPPSVWRSLRLCVPTSAVASPTMCVKPVVQRPHNVLGRQPLRYLTRP